MHVAFDDAGLAHAQVSDHQQLVQVLLVRGLHPGGPLVLRSLEPALGNVAGAWAQDGDPDAAVWARRKAGRAGAG